MDEIWEMNIHLNPIDNDMKMILENHNKILTGGMDHYIQYVKHNENEKLLAIKQNLFLQKL